MLARAKGRGRKTKAVSAPPADRAGGPTFPIERVGFIDFETRSKTADIRKTGAVRYATEADAIILAYAIGAGPVQVVAVRNFERPLDLVDLPTELLAHHAKVMAGQAVWAAWNSGFDRAIWNYATQAFPEMRHDQMIDVMAQAVASGLPPDLETASGFVGGEPKDKAGAELIEMFCIPGAVDTPQTRPDRWGSFLAYATQDIRAMRSVFLATRQLPLAEWREFWAMEAINDRGARVDLRLATAAAKLAAEDKVRSSAELREITGDPKMTPDMVKRMAVWLLDRMPFTEARELILKREEEIDDDGVLVKPAKYKLTRRQVERLIVIAQDHIGKVPGMGAVLRLLQIRLYGGSKTPAKFAKILASHVDGVLYGQYAFNGAGQTGRASSRGVQVHNLARDTLADEVEVIDEILRGCSYDDLNDLSPDPVARQLSLLIRPTFIPSGDNVFVWSDWSQIEARVLPWLAGDDPGALARLEIFREVDANPGMPDLYTRTAAVLSHTTVEGVDKAMRQRGKVAELALGFAGGVGALQAMGAGYGLNIEKAEARETVDRWRAANQWCEKFWRDLDEAVARARDVPRSIQYAGRLKYVYRDDYFGGTLFCILPSLRALTYRNLRVDRVPIKDDDDKIIDYEEQLRFSRGYGRVKLWRGMLCENAVQAVAADCLRGTLVRLELGSAKVRLHTHDEIVVESPLDHANDTEKALRATMQEGFWWSEGLPLMSEETQAYYYTKHEGSHGL